MRFAAAIAALVGVAAATSWGSSSNSTEVYVTEVVTAYTTYCPEATSITHNGVTYTVSSATTLTITNCPCTVTKPASSAATSAATSVAAVSAASVGTVKPVASGTAAKGTAASSGAASTSTKPSSPITPATGAGSQLQAAGAAVLAVFGLVAAL